MEFEAQPDSMGNSKGRFEFESVQTASVRDRDIAASIKIMEDPNGADVPEFQKTFVDANVQPELRRSEKVDDLNNRILAVEVLAHIQSMYIPIKSEFKSESPKIIESEEDQVVDVNYESKGSDVNQQDSLFQLSRAKQFEHSDKK